MSGPVSHYPPLPCLRGLPRMPRAHCTGNDFVPLLLLVVSFESLAFHGVRYQVHDVSRSVAFYIQHLGFKLEHQQLPAFASVSLDDVQVLLSGPGASGSRPMPDGRPQVPGGWNRVVLRVADLPSCIESLKHAGLHFRNEMEVGPAG